MLKVNRDDKRPYGSNCSPVEDPGYPVAWMTMKYRKMKVTPVPVDEHGLVIEKVPADTKLILVTPAHQCAVGVMLSEPRRQQLLHRAAQQRAWIVEDDYDSEFRYREDPMLTLFSQLPQFCVNPPIMITGLHSPDRRNEEMKGH
ncbi:hypothetical protein AMQ84_01915 [Paenibacillus riograndensis]|uniref:Aminotransferase class I/classII domain-containing protein n=1 Tax=Paenibacillus riograndensis TaxID=483937 RepID=A0A132UC66_9BACL|nr:hypothetical protein AMQ84_01915 [Paenibacillus riograndensis]